jgi:hypothetical protein
MGDFIFLAGNMYPCTSKASTKVKISQRAIFGRKGGVRAALTLFEPGEESGVS